MKTIVGISIFFLSLNLALPVSAAEVSFELPADYKATEIVSLAKAKVFTFDFEGNYIVAEDVGMPATKKRAAVNVYRIVKVSPDGTAKSLLERTGQTITNLSYHQGTVYVVTRGQIYKIAKGKLSDVISALPAYGDYGNGNLVFKDGSMYFTTGTATNSGIVGPDNAWLSSNPWVRDIPCASVKLSGVNSETDNFLSASKGDKAKTGSFMPFNTPVNEGQTVYGMLKCGGAVIKASPDGVMQQVYAWGLHNPKGLSVDDSGKLWVFDSGMEDRGVRPVKDAKDAFYQVYENAWFGWPDFNAGVQISQPPILASFPNTPQKPLASFDLNQLQYVLVSPERYLTNAAIAQSGETKLLQLSLGSGQALDFLTIKGAKILQYKFGPEDKLYVLAGLPDGSAKLYSIENTKPVAVTSSVSPSRNSAANNWSLGISLAILTSAIGFYVVRNLRPVKPLQ